MAIGTDLPKLDRYEVVREIGRGGMAVVYLARQRELERDIALKKLRLFDADDASAARRFLQESRVGASLSHPNVVTVHDYFEHDGMPYIAMEYLPRGSVRPHVGRTSAAESVGVLEGVLSGLDHASRRGIVHRDIKPENVMVTAEGHVKIADFGIAKPGPRLERGSLLTETGVPVGTPAYMAPEQVSGEEIGPWTDLFSVGVVAWELFVGRTPFSDAASPIAVLLRNLNETIPDAHEVAPSVDPAISAWIGRLLVKDPHARVRSAAAAWDELREIAAVILGSDWRRYARLGAQTGSAAVTSPLTPAPFIGADDLDERPGDVTENDASRGAASIRIADRRAPFAAARPARPARPAPPAPSPAAAPPAPPPASPLPAPSPLPPVAPVWTDVVAAPDRRRTALVAAVVALVAIVAGWLAAGPGGPGAPRTTLLANSDLQVAVPVAWTGARTAPRIPGLGAHGAVTAGPGGSGQTGVEANVITYHPPSLLSKAMGAAVAGRVPAPAAVRLGDGVEAYRYDRLRLDGFAGRVTVYAVPTTDSVATLACYAPTALARRFDATCATVAATLRPTSARPVPVGPSRAFAARVSRELAGLRADAAAPQRRLARATRRRDQAKAAQDLARAYERVAGALDELPDRVVDGIAIARAAAAIGDTAGAYDQLATAARTGAQADYDRARRALGAARTQLSKARRTFARGGYETR